MRVDKDSIYNELLIVRCQQGDSSAWQELVARWEQRLFYYIRRLIRPEQEAWQVLQEVWLKVLQGIGRLREPASFAKWIYSITRHTAMSHLRDNYARQKIVEAAEFPIEPETGDDTWQFDNAEQIHYGLEQISLSHREILTLFFLEDLSLIEIAEILEIPKGTVKSRIYHAKRALRKVLEGEERKNG